MAWSCLTGVKLTEKHLEISRICPYFTRFPLQFPLLHLEEAHPGQWLLDPFCGSGTALFAARVKGLNIVGVDASPVAVTIARAKLRQIEFAAVVDRAAHILMNETAAPIPEGTFWERCYAPDVLDALCRLRRYFMRHRRNPVDTTLCALILGLLHGQQKGGKTHYFSNHLPADFSPAQEAAIHFWKQHNLNPPRCDIMDMIRLRAAQVLTAQLPGAVGVVRNGDSRSANLSYGNARFNWIITSPPYFGMDTYQHDQWLRNWFLGGPTSPERKSKSHISHQTPEAYVGDLSKVWRNASMSCVPGARMIIRIGTVSGISSPPAIELLQASFQHSGFVWKIINITPVIRDAQSQKSTSSFMSPAPWPENETEVFAVLQP